MDKGACKGDLRETLLTNRLRFVAQI